MPVTGAVPASRKNSIHSDLPDPGMSAPAGWTAGRVQEFRTAVTEWFRRTGRDYPWRRTRDPYAILVSEVMLQQTQIATVLGRGYYTRWLERFPDVQSLAGAEEPEILRVWEGLGYYSRARNLQKAARAVVEQHGGQFPATAAEVLTLPGVGRYTAGAVASFAWNHAAAIVDGNVARVLARLFDFRESIDSTAGQRWLWKTAEQLVSPDQAREYNSGLMELGQLICTPRQPSCEQCPAAVFCAARGHQPESLPVKKASAETEFRTEHAVLTIRDGSMLMRQETGKRRLGLWMLPERTEAGITATLRPLLLRTQYSITRYRVTLCIYDAPGESPLPGETWVPLAGLSDLPMPGPWRRAVNQLLPRA